MNLGLHHIEAKFLTWERKPGSVYETAIIRAGRYKTERIVPPAGEDHAFTRDVWDHEVQVCVSPSGRSVQVFVDGERVA